MITKEFSMQKSVLVAYATKTGATAGVAEAIAKSLTECGYAVDVKQMNGISSVEGYGAVVLGSGVNGARWLPEAMTFVKDHQAALNQIPLALFCVHIMNLGDDEQRRQKRQAYLDSVRSMVKARSEAYFAGFGYDPKRGSRFEGFLNRVFKIGPEGDCRDWEKIRAWANELPKQLSL
jgi:menaquinone-dependent protoporphyrinogen oxidase